MLPHGRRELVPGAVGEDVHARVLEDRLAHRPALPGRRERELTLVADRARHVVDELLAAPGDVPVVGVGLVELEHRELGVVLRREALVTEVLAQLVDALQPAHDQALEVQLGRDPQVEVAVQRVVVRHEGPGQRAAVERLEHGGLDLHEAVLVEEAADGRHRLRAHEEERARLVVGH